MFSVANICLWGTVNNDNYATKVSCIGGGYIKGIVSEMILRSDTNKRSL